MVLMIMFVPSVIYASEVTTTFVDGKTFNEKIKRLVAVEEGISDTSLISYDSEDIYITEFKRYEVTPSDAYLIDDNVVSTSDSVEKIYVWYDNNILYWYSKAEEVYLNSDATHMFHKLTKITTLNVSDFNTSNVKSM